MILTIFLNYATTYILECIGTILLNILFIVVLVFVTIWIWNFVKDVRDLFKDEN